jgi:hypothetical protein
MSAEPTEETATEAKPVGGGGSPGMSERTRHRIAVILVVVATFTGVLGLLSLWVKRQVFDTDRWVETSSALLANDEIRSEISDYLTTQIFSSGAVQKEVAKVLPPKAAPLAGPASAGLSQLFNKAVNQILQTSAIQKLWEEANRKASQAFIAVAEDKPIATDLFGNAQSAVGSTTLDLGQIRAAVSQRLGIQLPQSGLGSGKALGAAVQAGNGQAALEVAAPDEIQTVRDISNLIQKTSTLLVALTLVLLAVAIWIARGTRLRVLTAVGLAFVVVGLLTLTLRSILGTAIVNQLAGSDSVKPAAEAAWNIGTDLLKTMGVASVGYGAFILLGALLAGPTRAATWVRERIAPALRDPMWATALTVLLVIVLVWWGPTPALREAIGVILVAIVVTVGVIALRRQVMREFPAPETP